MSIYNFTVKNIDGQDVNLSKYKDKVVIIVNVASLWGLASKNYAQLNELYDKYHGNGLEILAFPCNQFSNQEPGTNEEIKQRIMEKWNPKFDLFARIDVNGANEDPLYTFLKAKQGTMLGRDIGWNYVKFLVDRNGIPVSRYMPTTGPLSMEGEIGKYLQQPPPKEQEL